MNQRAYTVFRDHKEIEKVFHNHPIGFSPQEAVDDVRKSLIEHDGYPSDIQVRCETTSLVSPKED